MLQLIRLIIIIIIINYSYIAILQNDEGVHGQLIDLYNYNSNYSAYFFLISLKEVIVQDQFEHLRISTEFPDSITLDQTVAVWKHVVLFQEKIKQV